MFNGLNFLFVGINTLLQQGMEFDGNGENIGRDGVFFVWKWDI
jgi:hypothetical protein